MQHKANTVEDTATSNTTTKLVNRLNNKLYENVVTRIISIRCIQLEGERGDVVS